jgi:hypothetical protein
MTYGVFQEYYTAHWTLDGSVSATGVIGTTQNGVMYLVRPYRADGTAVPISESLFSPP